MYLYVFLFIMISLNLLYINSITYLSYKENKMKSDYQHLLSCLKTNLNPLSPLNIFGPGLKRFSFCPSNEFELKVRWKGCDLAEKKFYLFTMTVALARKKFSPKKTREFK